MPTFIAAAGVLSVALVVAAAFVVWRHPLAVYGRMTRRALGRAGARRVFVETAVGRQAAWVGGSGPTLVLLHGAGDQAGTWARVVPGLLPRYRVIAPDLPGHGESAPSSGPLQVGTVVDGTAEVIQALCGDTPPRAIVGNSLGAWVAMLLATRTPAPAERLVLVNGGALRGDRSDITLTPTTRDEARVTIEALMGPAAARMPGFVLDDLIRVCRFGPLGRLAQTAGEMPRFVLDDRLDEVGIPVDLLWGENDRVFPLAYAERLLAGLAAARLTTLADCGHVPHQNHPRRFARALVDLLDRPSPEVTRASR